MDLKWADRLEGGACPASFKGSGAHIIGTGNHGGGQQERVLQRNTADIRAQPVRIRRQRLLQIRLHVLVQGRHQVPDGDLTRTNAGALTGGIALDAGILVGQLAGSDLFVLKPCAAQHGSRIQMRTDLRAGRIVAQHAFEHIGTGDLLMKT